MVGLAPRAPGDSVRPRRLSRVVVRPLNFTVRVRGQGNLLEAKSNMRRAIAKTLRLAAYLVRARALCKVVSDWFGYRCVCRICGCG